MAEMSVPSGTWFSSISVTERNSSALVIQGPPFLFGLGLRSAVVGRPGVGDLLVVVDRPLDQAVDGLLEGLAEDGQLVIDSGWDDGVHRALDEPVALQLAEGQGEHALADPVDLAEQLAETQRAALQHGQDQQRPLVADPVEDLADFAGDLGSADVP